MRLTGCLYQSVRHERAGRNDRIDDPPIDQLGDDQPLFGHCHGPCQRHHHKSIFVERHRFQYVGRFAELASGERSLRHGPHQAVNRSDLAQVQRFQRNQPILNRIVQLPVDPLSAALLPMRISVIALFQSSLQAQSVFL